MIFNGNPSQTAAEAVEDRIGVILAGYPQAPPLAQLSPLPPGSGLMAERLAMFPLGSVLVPGGVLPLHIFEPRYRVLMFDCLRAEHRSSAWC